MKHLTLLDQLRIKQLGERLGKGELSFLAYHLALYKIYEPMEDEVQF